MAKGDPRVIALDIETYGKVLRTADGRPLPPHSKDLNTFSPPRSLVLDDVAPSDLVQTVAITLPRRDPRPSADTPWSLPLLASLEPGDTMVLQMHVERDRALLSRWLAHADTLLGMNLLFDILYLRAFSPRYRAALADSHLIIDASVTSFLFDDTDPNRSLKAYGPSHLLYRYSDDDIGSSRFPSPLDPAHISYNAQDTHNTILRIANDARSIASQFPTTSRLSPVCLAHWSRLVWLIVRMSEAGIPLHVPSLIALEAQHAADASAALSLCADAGLHPDNTILGSGCVATQSAFIASCLSAARDNGHPDLLSHPLFELTEKKKAPSSSSLNRTLLRAHLPAPSSPSSPSAVLTAWDNHTTANKRLSSFTFPLLRHSRPGKSKSGKPPRRVANIINPPTHPAPPGISYAFPSWFMLPSSFKDDDGGEGGQRQGRLSATNPGAPTFPPDIRACETSRFGPLGRIVHFDLSQIELRTAALVSGDASLIRFYQEGVGDLHTNRAIDMFGASIASSPDFKSGDPATDPRQWAKRFNFGDLYLASALRLQKTLLEDSGRLIPYSVCEQAVADRPRLRPGLTAWQNSMLALARRAGYIELPITGHARRFAPDDHGEIVNFPIQTSAAVALLHIKFHIIPRLPPLSSSSPWCYLYKNVYDAGYFDCLTSHIPLLREIVASAVSHVATKGYWSWLEQHYDRHVPLAYDFKVHNPPPGLLDYTRSSPSRIPA